MEIIVSELRLATLIISSCLGGFLLTECICRQDMNIPRSLFFGDSGIFMPTTTVYAWPDINIGALECDIAPFIFWKNIIISFVIMRTSKTASYVKMYDLYSPRIPLPDNLFNGTVALMKPHFSGFSKHGSNPRCSGAFGVICDNQRLSE